MKRKKKIFQSQISIFVVTDITRTECESKKNYFGLELEKIIDLFFFLYFDARKQILKQ